MGKYTSFRPVVEALEDRLVPSGNNYDFRWNSTVDNDGNDVRNWYNATLGRQGLATDPPIGTTDHLTWIRDINLSGWDTNCTFNFDLDVDHFYVADTYGTHTITLTTGTKLTTHGPSLVNDSGVTFDLNENGAAASSLELVGNSSNTSAWTAGSVTGGGDILVDNGGLTLNPPAGKTVTLDGLVEVDGGQLYYTSAGTVSLDIIGAVRVEGGGLFYAAPWPTPVTPYDQSLTANANNRYSVTVYNGTFQVNNPGQKLTVGLPIDVTGDSAVLRVDSTSGLVDGQGVSMGSGTIRLQGGTGDSQTYIDVGSSTLDLSGGTLETTDNTNTNDYAKVVGMLNVGDAATLWIGYGLNGSGYATEVGPLLTVTGDVTITGTYECAVWVNAGGVVPFVSSLLNCYGKVDVDPTYALLAIDQHNGTVPSGKKFDAIQAVSIGGAFDLITSGFTDALNDASTRLIVTKS
jgi:hypothetical protein